ncbi:20992_t:CDS:2 [Rhizophagus irregularis]|nr:20992_t:CDS:2 [Rhizophagus irregularis]
MEYNNFDNQFDDEKKFSALSSEERLSNSSDIQVDICFDNLSLDELIILLDQKEKEMNFTIQSSQNQIEDLLKDAYDYLEEEEYLKLDIQDIKLEIDDLETMCI